MCRQAYHKNNIENTSLYKHCEDASRSEIRIVRVGYWESLVFANSRKRLDVLTIWPKRQASEFKCSCFGETDLVYITKLCSRSPRLQTRLSSGEGCKVGLSERCLELTARLNVALVQAGDFLLLSRSRWSSYKLRMKGWLRKHFREMLRECPYLPW